MNALAENLVRASLQGGLFIVVVFLICRVFRRLPAPVRYGLWWFACLQLPLRLLVFSPIALPLLPAPTSLQVTAPTTSFPDVKAVNEEAPVVAPVIKPQVTAAPKLTVTQAAILVWSAGVLVGLGMGLRALGRTRKALREATPVPASLEAAVAELSRRLGIAPPRLKQSRLAPCPLLAGWLRPTIVLPAGYLEAHDSAEHRMALAHEMAHLKRHDLWLAGVPALTQILFFFHPFAWLAVRETTAACEETCDLEALRLSGGSAFAYAELLINSAQQGPSMAAMGAASGFRLLQRRIKMLDQHPSSLRPGLHRSALALFALAAICSVPFTVTAQSAPPVVTPTVKNHVVRKVRTSKHKATANRLIHKGRATASNVVKGKKLVAMVSPGSLLQGKVVIDRALVANTPQAPRDGFINADFNGASFKDSLKAVFKSAETNYAIDSRVKDDSITCSLRHVTLEVALQTICRLTTQPVRARRDENGTYIIEPREGGDPSSPVIATKLSIYKIAHVPSTQAAKTLNDIFGPKGSLKGLDFQFGKGSAKGASVDGSPVTASADEYSNTVIVNASNANQALVAKILQEIDTNRQPTK